MLNASLIIPAYNEQDTIGQLVTLAVATSLFKEIVVVDDGSSDDTAEIARTAGAWVLVHKMNHGKSRAMLTGVQVTSSAVVCFLDADLLNITVKHLNDLISPVKEGRAVATLGIFTKGRLPTSLAQFIAPKISGQRCLLRNLLEGFDGWNSGFGVEVMLNHHLMLKGVKQLQVKWPGASQVMKEEKQGFWIGFCNRLRMFRIIVGTYWKIYVRR